MKILARIVQGLMILLVVAAGFWTAARFLPRPESHQTALRTLQSPWQPGGTNAFDDLWLFGYAVPAGERRRLVDADLSRIDPAGAGAHPGDAARAAGFASTQPSAEDRERLCRRDEDCLEKVEADRDGYRTLLARNSGVLRNIEALRSHSHLRTRGAVMASIPPFHFAVVSDTWHASRFLDGDVEVALASACADLSLWRRLATNTDSLIGAMVAVAASERQGKVLAQMLARLPRGTRTPTVCGQAFAPPAVNEGELGRTLAGEHRFVSEMMKHAMAENASISGWLVHDLRDSEARNAERFAPYLAGAVRSDVAADRKIQVPRPATAADWRCIGNLAGCMVLSVSGADMFQSYAWRMQDHRARLQLLAALAWLQAQPSPVEPLDALMARWPGQWPPPARQVEGNVEAGTLRIRLFYDERGDAWTVPAPASRAGESETPTRSGTTTGARRRT